MIGSQAFDTVTRSSSTDTAAVDVVEPGEVSGGI